MFINKAHEEAYKSMQDADFESAVKKYTSCLIQFPNSPELFSERGVAYLNLKQKENCLNDLNKSVELQPDYAYRFASRGHARDFFGDIDGAIEDYEIAAEMDPSDSIVYNNLGLLLEKKGNITRAKENYDRSDKLRKEAEEQEEIDIEDLKLGEDGVYEEKKSTILENESVTSAPIPKPDPTATEEIKKIFSDKSQWRDFLKFIKNGFKIK